LDVYHRILFSMSFATFLVTLPAAGSSSYHLCVFMSTLFLFFLNFVFTKFPDKKILNGQLFMI